MFTLLVCSDMFGSKVNLEITFSALPTIGELTRRIEDVCTQEMYCIRPTGAMVPPDGIKVSRLQIYDDIQLKWVDLISSQQLHEYDQIYVFQAQTPWQIDTQQDLPAPRPPTSGSGVAPTIPPPQGFAPAASPMHAAPPVSLQYTPGPGGMERANIPPDDKSRVTFEELDITRKRFLDFSDLEKAFRERGLDFSNNTVGELFYKADLNKDGKITLDEWTNWGLIYPNTLDCLYFRGRHSEEENAIQRQIQQSHERASQCQARDAQLKREIQDLEAANRGLEDEISRLQARVTEAAKKKQVLDPDERELIEEEIRLERQHDQMRISKARFQEASERFNRGAAAKGSPRRARETVGY
eukprot:TRINITY_DN10625_c0_g1_i3.p1 TRINITY_DN10625_c0_g1~~TRINITY_DN10625_c0_g1_i3.p1  ORF type:complete len:369 (+),score=125.93 TRINITY_DN10625_c0_g1_i3:45-1109(+)